MDLSFVLGCNVGNLFGQGEDQVEVPHGQQFRLARRQPCFCGSGLAFGTVTIAAGITGDVLMRAVSAAHHMTARRRRAAALNGTHDFELVQAKVPCIRPTPCSTMGAENIRDLQRLNWHGGL